LAPPQVYLPMAGTGDRQDWVSLVNFQWNDFCDEMEILVAVKEKKVVFQSNLCDQTVNGAPYDHTPFATSEKNARCFGKRVDSVFGMEESLGFEVTSEQVELFL
jgi:hypothetical protein